MSDRLARIVAAHWFTTTILAVIVVAELSGARRPGGAGQRAVSPAAE